MELIQDITKDERPSNELGTTSYASLEVTELTESIVFNFLYNCKIDKYVDKNLIILNGTSFNSIEVPYPSNISPVLDKNLNTFIVPSKLLVFSIKYLNEIYHLSFFRYSSAVFEPFLIRRKIYITGNTKGASEPIHLFNYLFDEGKKRSNFKNKILKHNASDKPFLESTEIIKPYNNNLNQLFLSEFKKEQVMRFIHAVKSFSKDKISLRYLFNGIPGTGKTELIKAILSQIYSSITVLITNGFNLSYNGLQEKFEFLRLFDAALLVIDDMDFAVRDRDSNLNSRDLAEFLQFLDGFFSNNVFVLATTNDKKLVDIAASRPGRFDLIMDLGEIDFENYYNLINRETIDEDIIKFFDEEFLLLLKSKKVTGAYIVSLIKQLKSAKKLRGTIDKLDFINYFNLTHKGFYNSNLDNYVCDFGFKKY